MRQYTMLQNRNMIFPAFFLGILVNGCLKIGTVAQAELAATEDMTCATNIQKDVDANQSFENILTDPIVDAACVQATKDTGIAIEDIITDVASKSPNTTAGKQTITRKGAKL
jgi:hypothetical protein